MRFHITPIITITPIISLLTLATLAAFAQTPETPPAATQASTPTSTPVVVDLNPVAAGQEVILRWYFTGDKVTLSGGRFGKGTDVTGRTWITDRPKKTTRYLFTLSYRSKVTDPVTGVEKVTPVKANYEAVVKVAPMAPMQPYKARRGWSIWHLKSWKPEAISSSAFGPHYLVFFQLEDDALERLAVATVPSELLSTEQMLGKIRRDAMDKYESAEIVAYRETTHFEVPAVIATLRGKDPNHGMTQSLVLAFVRDGRAYFVSARTSTTLFTKKQMQLENMVRSLTVPTGTSAMAGK